eukprot:GHVU01048560.1.p4 GENE.GHVU01048560.1~~GHVU01048560.1.p4  ORF type:complete len:106 (+),score=15.56 GHVU01048560.1:368-685(+)
MHSFPPVLSLRFFPLLSLSRFAESLSTLRRPTAAAAVAAEIAAATVAAAEAVVAATVAAAIGAVLVVAIGAVLVVAVVVFAAGCRNAGRATAFPSFARGACSCYE